MIKKYALFFFVLFCAQVGDAKFLLLDKVITIDIQKTAVKKILNVIEVKGQVKFSYDPDLVDENKIVSLSIKEKTIRYGLSLIFDGTIRFKEVGSHIVLLQNESREAIKERKKDRDNYIFTGKIFDKRSGKPLVNASVYDVDARFAAKSDQNGLYELVIPKEERVRSLYFKKKDYEAVVIVIAADNPENLVNNILLNPISKNVRKIEPASVEKVQVPIEERALSGALISEDTYIHSENLDGIEEIRLAQISLVPSVGIGSNLSTNGLITNRVSLNVLAGYSKGVRGVEVGGILNMTKGDVRGAQVAGISNLVGGDVTGGQVAGIASLIQGNFTGAQVSGISGIVKRDFYGVQASGISSIVRGRFEGIQISGISNIAYKSSRGIQVAGISNTVFDTLIGIQGSGIVNFALHGTNYAQVSGIANIADSSKGVQISGIFNRAKVNSGFQLGLINCSKSSTGIALGLFNFVREGYHKTELSANEIFPVNLTFKTGSKRLYNSYHFGLRFGQQLYYSGGLGFGTYFDLADRIILSVDLTGDLVFKESNSNGFAQLYKLSTTFDYQLAKWVTVFGGPSISMNVMQFKDADGLFSSDIAFRPFYTEQNAVAGIQGWVGGQLGFRF